MDNADFKHASEYDWQLLRYLMMESTSTDSYHESVGPDDIKSGDTEETLGVIHTSRLEHLCSNGHGGVHRVADDVNQSSRAVLCYTFNQSTHNACVDVEQIISRHAWLSWNSSRNDDQVHSVQSRAQLILAKKSSHLERQIFSRYVKADQ